MDDLQNSVLLDVFVRLLCDVLVLFRCLTRRMAAYLQSLDRLKHCERELVSELYEGYWRVNRDLCAKLALAKHLEHMLPYALPVISCVARLRI